MLEIKQTTDDKLLEECARLMHGSEPWVTFGFSLDKCITTLEGPYKEIYVVTNKGRFAGFAVILLYGVLRGYIQTICLKPEYRNKGIGTALLKYCEDRILKSFPNVFICVSSFNQPAQQLYLKLGFEKIGELKDHLIRGHDEYILRKNISPFSEFEARV